MNLPSVQDLVPGDMLRIHAGTVLLQRGQTGHSVLHIQQGRVKVGVLGDEGLEHHLATIEGPSWLEASAALLGLPHAVDAVSDTDLLVEVVALDDFLAQVRALPRASEELLLDLARAQRQQTEVAVSRLAMDADARCAQWLLAQAEPQREGQSLNVVLRERKRSIAAQLGMAPETFSRVLRHLRERDLIAGSGRQISLPNPQALRELAGV